MTEWTALRNRLTVWKAGQASGIIKLVSRGLQKNKIPFARKPLSPCSAQVFIFHAEVSPTLNTAEACRKGPCLPENSPQQGSLPCLENVWTYEKLLLKKKKLSALLWWLSGRESACQCRRHGFDPCSRKIPPCHRATTPMCHNYLVSVLEPGSCNYRSP